MAEHSFSPSRLPGFSTIAVFVFVILYAPILMLVFYSFNAGKSLALWEGFSMQWYGSAWNNEHVRDATIRSLIIASFASVIATTAAGVPRSGGPV
jgi:spermidine/putrescine transport system permease protein